MTAPYDIDAKAAELGRSIIGRPVQSYLRSILAAALREARETAIRECAALADNESCGSCRATKTFSTAILALLTPAETETPDVK